MPSGHSPSSTVERSAKMNLNKVGTIPSTVTGLDVQETGVGPLRQTVFTFTNFEVTMTDEAGVVAYGGKKIYDFPNGVIDILGACSDLDITKSGAGINADFDGDFGVGTATASNNATLTGTEQNVIPSTATPQAVAGVTTADGIGVTAITALTDNTGRTPDSTIANHADLTTYANDAAVIEANISDLAGKINELIAASVGRQGVRLNGTSSAPSLYTNFLIDDADQDGGGTLILNGTIAVSWMNHGDK